ncbi:GNAT family N-acetyltransferase [Ascidiimonas sp. W6]|uniref:GNAT family N-acetyltransferase n=1 Tax=Ascidiimonas meishanensis TaxID=3128903 RepID=UPI0030EC714F
MVTIKEVSDKKDLDAFVKFQFSLYKNSPYWIPPIIKDEKAIFDKEKNPIYKDAEAHLFLAYKDGKIVGRIAAIINWLEVKTLQKKKLRFGWFDVIDDLEVSRALFDKIIELGIQKELAFIDGPVGFSNMDKAGMLVLGFDRLNNMTTLYNYDYYPKHMEALGFNQGANWVEYEIDVPKPVPPKVKKFSKLVLDRYQLSLLSFKSTKEMVSYADKMFDLMNRSFKELQSFVPIQQYQVEMYKEKYLKFLHPDYITLIADKNERLVGFSVTMPSFARALQKANGKLYPLGFLHLLIAKNKNKHGNLFLIGIDPEYQGKGLTAVIFERVIENYNKRGITLVESNPELEENQSVQIMWKNYNPRLIKRWRTYAKTL